MPVEEFELEINRTKIQEEENVFQKLELQLMDMPSLYIPNLGKLFLLYTDAYSRAIRACLSQKDSERNENPISFYKKNLTTTQSQWLTTEHEAYTVLAALKGFDMWIFDSQVEDNNPLMYLTQGLPHKAKLSRWSFALQRYNMTITYRTG